MEEIQRRQQLLRTHVERRLPEFAANCKSGADIIAFHQGDFAAQYRSGQYALLGQAIKYAGLAGVDINIINKNRE